MATDIEAHCDWYEEEIAGPGGIDVQVLGIGANGHIAFNEPGSSLGSRTRVKTLTQKTREDNARFFGIVEEVPRYAITMGIGTIMEARELSPGGHRRGQGRGAARRRWRGPSPPWCPPR